MDGIHRIFWELLSLNLKLCRKTNFTTKKQARKEASQHKVYNVAVVNYLLLLLSVVILAVVLLLGGSGGDADGHGGGGAGLSSSGFRKQTPCATVYCDGPPSCNCSNSCYNGEASRVHQGENCARPVYAIVTTAKSPDVPWNEELLSNGSMQQHITE